MTGFSLSHAVAFGALLSVLASAWIAIVLRINPRVFLRNYPTAIRQAAAPLSAAERRMSALLAISFFALLIGIPTWSALDLVRSEGASQAAVWLDAFVVSMIFNIVDLVVIDILWLGPFPPAWAMIPGTEHVSYRPEFARHVRGFSVGTIVAAVVAFGVSALVHA